MSRKDFILIASVLRNAEIGGEARTLLAERFANVLACTNPNFNRERFLKACDAAD